MAAFFRVGMLGFGGGPSSIPLVYQETVKKYQWMDKEEFDNTLALANTMPGPIITKMAGYIGYRIAGVLGCLNALLSSVAPTAILMILLLQFLQTFKGIPWVNHMSASVVPVVAVMLGVMTWDFMKKSVDTLKWKKTSIFLGGGFLLIEVLHFHPAIVIVLTIIFAFLPSRERRRSK